MLERKKRLSLKKGKGDNKMVKKYRMFNGKRYKLTAITSKWQAKKFCNDLRSKGYNCRIIKGYIHAYIYSKKRSRRRR